MLIIPKEIIVGYNIRLHTSTWNIKSKEDFDNNKFKMGFITYQKTKNKKADTKFDTWINKSFEFKDSKVYECIEDFGVDTVINDPISGYKLLQSKSYYSSYYGTTSRITWSIEHPNGFIFEISLIDLFKE